MGLPVVIAVSGGLPVTVATSGFGVPMTLATNGFGLPVTQAVNVGGLAVTGITFGGGALSWTTSWNGGAGGASSGWANFTLRQVFPASIFTAGGANVRVSMSAAAGATCAIGAAYFQRQASSGDAWDFTGTPVPLLVGGVAAFVIPTGATVVSDPVVYAFDNTKNYVFTAFFSGTSTVCQTIVTGAQTYSKAGNDAAVADVTGHSASGVNSCRLFSKVEVAS